jgi:SnoaL-like domain
MNDHDLAQTVRRLDDTRQIINALNVYALAIDGHRYELFDQVFAPDVYADYNPPVAWTDRESIRRDMEAFHLPLDGCLHRITNHQVTVDGDRANSICYVKVHLVRGDDFYDMHGFYDDEFARTSEGWRIKRRYYRGSWWSGNPRVLGGPPDFVFVPEVKTLRHSIDADKVSYIKALARGR